MSYWCDALKENSDDFFIVRSFSDDSDIIILVLTYLCNERQRVSIDSGYSTNQNLYWMKIISFSEVEASSLILFDALTSSN